jgi:hypothetical protein
MSNNGGGPSDGRSTSKRRRQSKHDIDFLLGRPQPPTPPGASAGSETTGHGEQLPAALPPPFRQNSHQLPPLAPHGRHLASPGASSRPQAVPSMSAPSTHSSGLATGHTGGRSSRAPPRADSGMHGVVPPIAPATSSSSSTGSAGAGASSNASHATHATHASRNDRPFVCEVCGFSFSQRSDRAKVCGQNASCTPLIHHDALC